MSAFSSPEYVPEDSDIDIRHADPSSDTDSQGSSDPHAHQRRRARQAQLRPGSHDPSLQRSLSQPRQLRDQPDQVVQTGPRKSSQGQSRERQPRSRQSSKSKGIQSGSAQSGRKEVKKQPGKAYLNLLNEVIHDVNGSSARRKDGSLACSTIGASFWSSREKRNLFRALEHCTVDDLPSLRQAIPTKSESEIQSYLLLLQGTLLHKSQEDPSKVEFSLSDVPAAFEMSAHCEGALGSSADVVARLVYEQDVRAEQMEFGHHWLLDSENAQEVEEQFEQRELEKSDVGGFSRKKVDDTPVLDDQSAHTEEAATLLNPAALLQLSKNVFMNSDSDPDMNWSSPNHITAGAVEEPAIFRSAFQDFHNLAVSVTRRIVQATIFQAMSRLRAGDSSRTDWEPVAMVRPVDVDVTLEILNMKPNRKSYWAKAPRRCRVAVYSDSKKYADGRPGTKMGHRLTVEEVEAELKLTGDPAPFQDKPREHTFEDDVEELLNHAENLTDAEDSVFDDENIQDEVTSRSRSQSRKRKRALSPASFHRAETAYCTVLDYNADAEEEQRLRELLSIEEPAVPRQNSKMLNEPGPAPLFEKPTANWRSRVEYESLWERAHDFPNAAQFDEMDSLGEAGRKRRRMVIARAGEQLGRNIWEDDEDFSDERDGFKQDLARGNGDVKHGAQQDVENGTKDGENDDNETTVGASDDEEQMMERCIKTTDSESSSSRFGDRTAQFE